MKIDIAFKNFFQIALLLVLIFIAVGIWWNRQNPAVIPQGDGFVDKLPPVKAPFDFADDQGLKNLIESGDVAKLRETFNRAQGSGDVQFLLRAFNTACSLEKPRAIEAIELNRYNLTQKDSEDLEKSLDLLADRRNEACLQAAMTNFGRNFGLQQRLTQWIIKQFERTPWDSQRFELVVRNNRAGGLVNEKLVLASLTGSEERYNWLCDYLSRAPRNELAAAFNELNKNPSIIKEENVGRVLGLLAAAGSGVGTTFEQVIPFLKPEHFESFRKVVKKQTISFPAFQYILKQPPEVLRPWLEQDNALLARVHDELKKSLQADSPPIPLSEFEPLAPMLAEVFKASDSIDMFGNQSENKPRAVEWLWAHGFRPGQKVLPHIRIYLAIHFKDRALLEDAMRSSPTLSNYINMGWPEFNEKFETYVFVPLLETIRTWDLEAVKILMSSKQHDWRIWRHPNPLMVAIECKKQDVYEYLLKSGVTFDEDSRKKLATDPAIDTKVMKDAIESSGLPPEQMALNLFENAVKSGDMKRVEEMLKTYKFRREVNIPNLDIKQQFTHLEASCNSWRSSNEIVRIVDASIPFPAIFARLQSEGFPIGVDTVIKIIKADSTECLEMALSDLATQTAIAHSAERFLPAVRTKPEMVILCKERGVFDNLFPEQKDAVAKLYQQITGKPFTR